MVCAGIHWKTGSLTKWHRWRCLPLYCLRDDGFFCGSPLKIVPEEKQRRVGQESRRRPYHSNKPLQLHQLFGVHGHLYFLPARKMIFSPVHCVCQMAPRINSEKLLWQLVLLDQYRQCCRGRRDRDFLCESREVQNSKVSNGYLAVTICWHKIALTSNAYLCFDCITGLPSGKVVPV